MGCSKETIMPWAIDTGYEYDNIQEKLNRMTEVELQSDYAHELMDRAEEIRKEWRK